MGMASGTSPSTLRVHSGRADRVLGAPAGGIDVRVYRASGSTAETTRSSAIMRAIRHRTPALSDPSAGSTSCLATSASAEAARSSRSRPCSSASSARHSPRPRTRASFTAGSSQSIFGLPGWNSHARCHLCDRFRRAGHLAAARPPRSLDRRPRRIRSASAHAPRPPRGSAEQLVVRILAHRPTRELHLAAAPGELVDQQHLADVVAGQPIRRDDHDQVELDQRRIIPQPV